MIQMIPINRPLLDAEEKDEVMSVLDEGALTSAAKNGGKRVRNFECHLRDFLNVKHVVAVNSGTAALYAALLAANIEEGDEVFLPSFTFVATANSVAAVGAKPVFIDINKDDYTMDVSDLKTKVGNKSKAIIPVHIYGHPCTMDEISEIADKYSLKVIEDACQSVGSTYKNRQTGTMGLMGCFSMYASKVLTCGEGGAIATNSDELAEKLKMIRNHGMVDGYDTRVLGLNLRLPEMSAAIAKVQMNKLPKMLDSRRKNAELMSNMLFPIAKKLELKLPEETETKKFNWYLYTVAFKHGLLRDKVKEKMINQGIGAMVYYDPPTHRTPFYRNMLTHSDNDNDNNNNLYVTDWAAQHLLSLPVHPFVTEQDIEKIVHVFE